MMESIGALNPINTIEAKIQSLVAKFLAQKETLLSLMNSNTITIKTEATELYNIQLNLEKRLEQSLKDIEVMKTGSWTFSNITMLTLFSIDLKNHTDDVDRLKRDAGISGVIPDSVLTPAMLALGVGIIGFMLLKRR